MSGRPERVAVALNIPIAEPFSYSVPEVFRGDVPIGALVEVPLSGRVQVGCVVEHDPPQGDFALLPIKRRVSPQYILPREIMDLSRWLADYYFCSFGEALAAASLVGFSHQELIEKSAYRLADGWISAELTKRQREVAEALALEAEPAHRSLADIGRAVGATSSILKKLYEAGVLEEIRILPDVPFDCGPPDSPHELFAEQQVAFDAIEAYREEGKFGVFLLHGITGSGKTEVYLRLIERAFAAGQSALCLVPEIALTPQTVSRFSRRFQEEVGVYHSQMTRREKLLLYKKIIDGRIRLVIGARSATFSPLPNLGIIVIDEEHEGSYKQGETPRYHARDVAIVRASKLGIPVVLGSATPSLESYENARSGKYHLYKLTSRPAGLKLPEVKLIPMNRKTIDDPTGISLLSDELKSEIDKRLERNEQVLIFLNRRGFSNFLMCPMCKWVARCEDDDIVLTIHRKGGKGRKQEAADEELELELFPKPLASEEAFVKCHFCSRLYDYPRVCPSCGEKELMAVGTGTQRIEECLRRVYPDTPLLRLDQDVITSRHKFLEAWEQMISGEARLILGTQMIAKGLHLERVTLVGVILAEIGLFIPDFRAEERTFSLLMQVAGRSGRTDMGEVMLQTYMAHHAAVQMAARHDYEGFFEVEMQRRRRMGFPPVQKMLAITISDPDPARARGQARILAGVLRRLKHRYPRGNARILGPQDAPIARLGGRFRQRILLTADAQKANQQLLRAALADREWRPPHSMKIVIDVDPLDLL